VWVAGVGGICGVGEGGSWVVFVGRGCVMLCRLGRERLVLVLCVVCWRWWEMIVSGVSWGGCVMV
jgi:hypothetical protein